MRVLFASTLARAEPLTTLPHSARSRVSWSLAETRCTGPSSTPQLSPRRTQARAMPTRLGPTIVTEGRVTPRRERVRNHRQGAELGSRAGAWRVRAAIHGGEVGLSSESAVTASDQGDPRPSRARERS